MADEASSRLFSQRHGYWSPPKEITVREDAPENLRYVLLETILQVGIRPHTARTVVCRLLRQREGPNNWSEFPNV